MKKLVSILVFGFVFSSSAHAWGDREQGIVTGIASLWMYQQLQKAGEQPAPTVIYQTPIYQSPPVYHAPAPQVQLRQYCEWTVVTNQFGERQNIQFCYQK